MGIRRFTGLLLGILITAVLLSGCGRGSDGPVYEYSIYYVNKENTKVLRREYQSKTPNTQQTADQLIAEFLQVLATVSDKPEYVPPISGNVAVLGYEFEEGQITLDFEAKYLKQDVIAEILARAAIVRTLAQVKDVKTVSFFTEGIPLTDATGLPIGTMAADSFIDNAGNEINAYEQAQLHLYFANEKGDKLLIENRKVLYNSNISLERIVIDELIKGPSQEQYADAFPIMNPSTSILGVTVKDGVCYINLSEEFLTQIYNVSTEVTLYGIANSLAELPNVNKVQISINGEADVMFRESVSLASPIERNLDIMEE